MDENTRTAELRRKLEKDPASRLFAQLAEELRKDGRHDEAISVARGGLEKNPNYPSARLTLARALLDSGRPVEARPELESVVRSSPDNILAGRLLAETLAEMGEVEQAIKQFERALIFVPGDKAITERLAELKAAQEAPAPPAAAPAAPAVIPPMAEAPSLFGEAAPLPSVDVADGGALPSLFADEPPAVPGLTASVPEAAPPAVPIPAPAPSTPPTQVAAPSAPALDRDLASGTFSPGSLNVNDLQKHFEAAAAAERITALAMPGEPSSDLEATIGTGDLPALSMPDDPYAVDETLNLRAMPAMEVAAPLAVETSDFGHDVASDFPSVDTGEALSMDVSTEAAPAGIFEAPEMGEMDPSLSDLAPDPGGATLPLTSMTLADLYLQQGLKQEASAVLSQVVRDEPDNAAAQSRLAQVSAEVAAEAPAEIAEATSEFRVAETLPPRAAPAPAPAPVAPVVPPVIARAALTKAQIRERTILSLKAFESAVEREALQQKASERSAF